MAARAETPGGGEASGNQSGCKRLVIFMGGEGDKQWLPGSVLEGPLGTAKDVVVSTADIVVGGVSLAIEQAIRPVSKVRSLGSTDAEANPASAAKTEQPHIAE